jgi:hypothetical protein
MAVERMLDMLAGLGGNTLYGNQLLQALKWPPNAPLPEEGKDHQDSLRKLAVFAAMTPAFQVR